MPKVVHVAVAIIQKSNGEYLLASRPQGKGWAGWWEFPGGKIEANEAPEHALTRELQEELGITPTRVQQWIKRRYDYPATHDAQAKTVLLHFYFVFDWLGEPQPLEGQILAWQHPQHVTVNPVLPANAPIMHALSLPVIYAISNATEMGETAFLQALRHQLDNGLQLLQIREPQLQAHDLEAFTQQVLSICASYAVKVLLNGTPAQAQAWGVHGVHLNRHQLMHSQTKPNLALVAASCHNLLELQQAQSLVCDFVVLSPVLPTRSHPKDAGIGWHNFAELVADCALPVYALGGMNIGLQGKAQSAGARGIAMQRAIWSALKTIN